MIVNSVTRGLLSLIKSKVSKAGSTMTGPLVLSQDPTLSMHAVTKQYADTKSPLIIPITEVSSNLTLTQSHCGVHIVCVNSDSITITVPASLPIGWNCTIEKWGEGAVGIASNDYSLNGGNSTLYIGPKYRGPASIVIISNSNCSVQGAIL